MPRKRQKVDEEGIASLRTKERRLKAKLRVAESHEKLARILEKHPILLIGEGTKEWSRHEALQTKLQAAFKEHFDKHREEVLKRLGLDEARLKDLPESERPQEIRNLPTDPEIQSFTRNYVNNNWSLHLGHEWFDEGKDAEGKDVPLPDAFVVDAKAEFYKERKRLQEVRAVSWFYTGRFRKVHDKYWAPLRLWKLCFDPKYRREYRVESRNTRDVRRAGELVVEHEQEKMQRRISWLQHRCTWITSWFMLAMQFLAILQLAYAVSFGLYMDHQVRQLAFRLKDVSLATLGCCKAAMVGEPSLEPIREAWNKAIEPHAASGHGSAIAMEKTLHALEMFLVAPLPYLLMLGLGRYIKALAYREEVDRYRAELLDFKGFEVALFISIIAAAVVGRALQDSTGSAPAAGSEAGSDTHSLSWQFALAAAILIATLAGYFLIIELRAAAAQRLNAEREKMRHEQEMAIIHAREGISDEP